MAKGGKRWMGDATPPSHEGRFTSWCEKHGGKKAGMIGKRNGQVTNKCIARAKRVARATGNAKLARQANLAATYQRQATRRKRK